jgi:DNA-3-methyladenine glycosylase I
VSSWARCPSIIVVSATSCNFAATRACVGENQAMLDLEIGADGRARCGWCGDDPLYRAYHDDEWGRELRGDDALFELLSLEGFQAGLSWLTILRKREGFRTAFAGFSIERVAGFDERDVQRLLGDAGIVRHRGKIEATIGNAVAALRLEAGLSELVWSFAPPARGHRPVSLAELPPTTAESTALSKELRRRGFGFVGPTTVYAFMQSGGLVDDHLEGCFVAG